MRKRKKVSRKVDVVVFSLLFILIVYTGSEMYRTRYYFSEEKPREFVASIEMSEKDREKDFEYLWKNITEGMPLLETIKNETGYDFTARKDFYEAELSECTTDFEFLCCIESVLNDIPSFHTTFFKCVYDEIESYYCFGAEMVQAEPKLQDTVNLWAEKFRQYYYDHRYTAVRFLYTDGRYLADSRYTDSAFSGYEVIEIDGMTPDEYIQSTLSVHHIYYDSNRDRLYRPALMFNSDAGEERKVTVRTAEGETETLTLYYDLEFEYALSYGKVEIVEDAELNYRFEEVSDDIVYCSIDSFSGSNGEKLAEEIRKHCFKDNLSVILDLRNNGGGQIVYAMENVYPYLFGEDMVSGDTEYIYKSRATKKLYSGLYGMIHRYAAGLEKTDFVLDSDIYDGKFLVQKEQTECKGQNTYSPDVYVLVSDSTGSAADHFTAIVSGLDNTVVIGTATGGEKLGGQVMDMLPESGLVYMFVPTLCFNDDGTDNSLYGTSPDIYAELSYEGYLKREELLLEDPGRDIRSAADRLIWDDVLKKAVEMAG